MKIHNRLNVFLMLFLLVGVLIINNKCYYDSEEYLFPELTSLCDTTDITYSGTVQPILNQYCLPCHSNATAASLGANIRLEDYSDVSVRAENGSLVGSMSHTGNYSPMPKGASQLNNCIVTGVQKWVDEGSLNN